MQGAVKISIGIVVTAMLCVPALARWKPEYGAQSAELQAWFKDQHNQQGQWCCDESDGHPFFGEYKINEDGSVTIQDGGAAHQLPAYMVLKGSNPTGHAVWWFTDAGGVHRDYCFAPGTLT
ncbi:MAG: hypothetical protein ACTHLO_16010 [Pseudolabrys sp.]